VKESWKDLLLYSKLIFNNLIFYSVDFEQLTFCIMGQLAKDTCEAWPLSRINMYIYARSSMSYLYLD